MDEIVQWNLTVSGRVQGVAYRAFTLKLANQLGVKGFVKNYPNGSVRIVAEGTAKLLKLFASSCEQGPGWAHVDKITITDSPPNFFKEFKVRY
jgi:acylphosphatase